MTKTLATIIKRPQMNNCINNRLTEMLAERPLSPGKHAEGDDSWCILEARSKCAGIGWTDDPVKNRTFDFRPVHEIPVSDSLRTEWMPKVMSAYEGALDWPHARQIAVVSRLVIFTVNRLIAVLFDFQSTANTLPEAKAMAKSAAARAEEGVIVRESARLAAQEALKAVRIIEAAGNREAKGEALRAVELLVQVAARSVAMTAWATAAAESVLAAELLMRAAEKAAEEGATVWAEELYAWAKERAKEARAEIFIKTCELWIEATL